MEWSNGMRDSIEQTSVDMVKEVEQFDAIIIGAGVTGLYQLYRLRQRGLSVRIFEDGSGVGGTWYWNRYPGARFDSESYTYGVGNQQKWGTLVKERSGRNGSVVGLPEQVVVALSSG